ncbi:DUF3231 family protein [Halalkalibacter akibai]|uniref:DUF3231 family protein n=1 Tax=Halalkalibacter akibai (strain ATCC 43226 / DSM 21942 / CIP 109018 / JCM 9157 / 1139) TaxID=1236973 RepID=W4R0U9_HALA3|nr:DUF3231 family protein [Halalkalibacter akibai]GAE37523.1 hypothetical protein JCM9157_4831 [Halalkalibacter akibai JCM 9157]
MGNHIDLTATEMGYLWSTYQAETMNYCILTYFNQIVEDDDIKRLNELTLDSSKENIEQMRSIFKLDDFPIPIGFTDLDVQKEAGQLYTDPFILFYQWFVGKGNLNYGSLAINTIAREDVFNFFEQFTSKALSLLNQSRKMLLTKGLWIRAPYIPPPRKVEFVKKESFLNGWFGDERPLAGIEIASIFYNLITNTIGHSLTKSFYQVTTKGEIQDYFKKGQEISEKHINILSKMLKKEDLFVPATWNAGVTDSTTPPFSEKLMLYFISFLNAQGLNNYGNAISNSIKRDVGADFSRLAAEVSAYGEEGIKLLIKNGWMEAPPQAPKNKK